MNSDCDMCVDTLLRYSLSQAFYDYSNNNNILRGIYNLELNVQLRTKNVVLGFHNFPVDVVIKLIYF